MDRTHRAQLAQMTLDIVAQGSYVLPDGRMVRIADDVQHCVSATRVFQPEDLQALVADTLSRAAPAQRTVIEIDNESTLLGIARLLREERSAVAALNFASARNPGGGFLNGSHAQEESLARSSALHASLLQARAYYEANREAPSPLYRDALILSPRCPVFRSDAGTLLEEVHHATFISGPAPNAGALRDQRSPDLARVPETLRRRIEYVLAVAASQGYPRIVLGAWGCGVFRNDPQQVASTFMDVLCSPAWAGRFSRVRFSILDPSPGGQIIGAFTAAAAQAHAP